MDIRFVSSLTPDVEDLVAPAILKAVAALLDQVPLAYSLRIETTGAQVLQHTHQADAERSAQGPSFLAHAAMVRASEPS